MKKVLVTGISGFLGSHIAAEGIKRGYSVRGTIRSNSKKEEAEAMFKSLELSGIPEFTEADLLKPDGWEEAVAGCDGIMHVASPFIIGLPKDEEELIGPAVSGVRHVLEAARNQRVNRIVQTSSIAAIMYGHEKGRINFSENNWTNLSGHNVSAYTKSKTLAEKTFWEIGKNHPELKLTSICPGFVTGPLLNRDPGTSVEVILKLLRGEYPGVPRLGFAMVDVRDVAALHWDAFEKDISIGKRYPAVSSTLWFREMAKMLMALQPEFASKIGGRELPDWFVRIYALIDKPIRMILPELGFCAQISAKAAIDDLQFHPMSVKDSLRDTVDSILKLGLVQKP